jgi:diguanylate cyclase (GGDEF)-like protein
LIDLDQFKKINDDFGHDAGDALLIEVARRLRASVRACDLVGRMGGDEFMVLIPDTGERASIDSISLRICAALGALVEFNGHQLKTAPSIGIAVFPDHGTSWQQVYKSADIALYDVRGNAEVFGNGMESQHCRLFNRLKEHNGLAHIRVRFRESGLDSLHKLELECQGSHHH